MAKHEGACPVATRIFILRQAEKAGVSAHEMIKRYSVEADIPEGTLRSWVWPEPPEQVRKRKKKKSSPEIRTPPEPDPVITEEDFTAPPEKVVRYKNTDAMYFVKLAILQLDMIKPEDSEGINALNFLSDYINRRIEYLMKRRTQCES